MQDLNNFLNTGEKSQKNLDGFKQYLVLTASTDADAASI